MKIKLLLIATLAVNLAFATTSIDENITGVSYDSINDYYTVTDDISLSADQTYILEKPTFVLDGASITIGEGAIVRGQPDTGEGSEPGILFICRGGQIFAEGTSTNPVIFTTAGTGASGDAVYTGSETFWDADPKNNPKPLAKGMWGALVILGKAPINTSDLDTGIPGEAYIEGTPLESELVTYGGTDVNDNSGVLNYVSIRYSGKTITDGDETQGLTTGGVGRGTQLTNIEIFGSDDDGIEIFGGTSEISNLFIIGADDDGFDGDHGWQGSAQFVAIVQQPTDFASDHAIELDGDDTGDLGGDEDNVSTDGRPFTSGHLTNFTVIGFDNDPDATTLSYPGADTLVRFRRGFGGSFTNSIVVGGKAGSLRIDNNGGVLADDTDIIAAAGYPSIKSDERVVNGSFVFGGNTFFNFVDGDTALNITKNDNAGEAAAISAEGTVIGTDPQFGQSGSGIFATDKGGVTLADYAAGTFNPVPNVQASAAWGSPVDAGAAFEEVSYRGAFAPAVNTDLWTTGWTASEKLFLTSSN